MAHQMPLALTISCSSKSRLVLPSWFLPFWYLLTRVVPDRFQKSRKTVVSVCVVQLKSIAVMSADCAMCSLCTTLLVEWEPDLVAVSLLYLSCKLTNFNMTSWVDKPSNYTGKWYTFFVKDINLDIVESKFFTV